MATVKVAVDALDPSNSSKNTLKLENTEKRDNLIAIEKKYQKVWQDTKVFEPNAPTLEEIPFQSLSNQQMHEKNPKFFGCFAYPYMNGVLHAGHSFTVSKVEFAAGWARMLGKRTLFPLGYHCTGMPIKACADKLEREIELFGKDFSGYDADAEEEIAPPAPTEADTRADITKFVTKKSKAAAKTLNMKYQFQIMIALGIPLEEIHRFADPQHWLNHFPGYCKEHLINFGARIDWRRSFVTTDRNPYYDTFVRWQMNILKEAGKIKFGKRYTVYSPKDGQPCLDHDRSSGEGVTVQEYTAVKMKVLEWSEKGKDIVAGKVPENANVYFLPATLRPETMYGQTCCFVGPKLDYGIFKVSETEYLFCSDKAARNMAFQSVFPEWGVFPKVASLQGSDVVGTLVNAPLSVHKDGVRILPMDSVKDTKGTAVVTCVPSDSPDDFATIRELAKKAEFYGIKKEWAELEIVPIIETPSLGNLAAPALVEKMKINSPKDVKQLAEAKEIAYKEGFYQGKLIYGEFSGKPVSEAKLLVKQQLIDSGDAFNYAEPDGVVMSRSGDVCTAALLDQWYMNYGKAENGGDGPWCNKVLEWVQHGLNTYYPECKHQFEQTLGWLSQWACARSYGLGTKLPWDHNFLVESLSDSTIYQSYYTVAHFLHSDIYGDTQGSGKIKPEQMTDEVWDYVFWRNGDVKTDIPMDTLKAMRREFEYWYPVDVRVSGKDLIQNHLTFFLYVHVAIFSKEHWPRSIRTNGHLLLNGEKMSKSTGNFLTLDDAVKKFGADATRIALADAGDGIEDANFDESVANANILRLYELKKWIEEMIQEAKLVKDATEFVAVRDAGKSKQTDVVQRTGELAFFDKLFENEMNDLVNQTRQQYDATNYKIALKTGFYDFTGARDSYRESCKTAGIGMHHDLIRRYVELQALLLTPIAPHFSEYLWREVLKKPETVQSALYPPATKIDPSLSTISTYIKTTSSNILSAEGTHMKRVAKGKNVQYNPSKDKRLSIFVAGAFPAWQEKYMELARQALEGLSIDMKKLTPNIAKPEMKKAMPFVQGLKRRLDSGETAAAVFDRELGFDEMAVLREMAPGLKKTVQKCVQVVIIGVKEGEKLGTVVNEDGSEGEKREVPPNAESAVPGNPAFFFENV
ncbi:leucyl-tRNA synthetase [Eremomyces bilateralis CBS 781.70]|uniref:leucine--tRNA ligase n=1 Tax=Eremomyces bilateralis CBS 781.70 TaxID=1392243 RepID=A0A6G1GI45_9PEZI|nr:leucyl-tRNA synthetase [Eremomyces bilateralis CBS 781.70]KAF1817626.1 leucyl-tRNA synthetase [Eremomyces bilateralis CBS 781.70]